MGWTAATASQTCGWPFFSRRPRASFMKILLIDDHPLFAFGFAHALSSQAPGIASVTASSVEQGIDLIVRHPDVSIALIDYRLGGDDGLQALIRIGESHPWLARVLISGQEDASLQLRARRAGASGFLGKSLPIEEIVSALYTIAGGGVHFGSGLEDPGPAILSSAPSTRQLEVLGLVSRGLPNKRIASQLGITERTVKLHVAALLDRLQADNRTHLLMKARERGLL